MSRSEEEIKQLIRLEASRKNIFLFRNNVGAMLDKNGRMVRFGLANDSKQINEKIKSSDLIGITPVTITQDMVGKTIGQFVSIECKNENWNPNKKFDSREQAQKKWIDFINSHGGLALFINKEGVL